MIKIIWHGFVFLLMLSSSSIIYSYAEEITLRTGEKLEGAVIKRQRIVYM